MSYWIPMLECVYDQISPKATDKSKDSNVEHMVQHLFKKGGITPSTLETPDEVKIDSMLEEYQQALVSMEDQFAQNVDLQRKVAAGIAPKDLKITNVENAVYNVALDTILIGSKMILNSLNKGKISKTTDMLMSGVPFLQTRMISSSPNIAHKVAADLMERVNDATINLIKKINEGEDLTPEKAIAMGENVFKNIVPHRPFIMKYAAGIEPEDSVYTNTQLTGMTGRSNREELLNKVISRRPVLTDKKLLNLLITDDDLRQKYFLSLAPAYMIIKEIYGNLGGIFDMLMQTNDQEKMSASFKKDYLDYYCSYFPGKMMNLALTLKQKFGPNPDGTYSSTDFIDYIEEQCNKAFGTTQHEIDKVNS